jgi:hypothetical protein
LALSLSILCFSLYGKDVTGLKTLLTERFAKTQFMGEPKVLALAVLALGDGARHFRV